MGRLAGLTYHFVVACLRRLGFVFDRSARGRSTVRAIVRQAGVDVDTFLGVVNR